MVNSALDWVGNLTAQQWAALAMALTVIGWALKKTIDLVTWFVSRKVAQTDNEPKLVFEVVPDKRPKRPWPETDAIRINHTRGRDTYLSEAWVAENRKCLKFIKKDVKP